MGGLLVGVCVCVCVQTYPVPLSKHSYERGDGEDVRKITYDYKLGNPLNIYIYIYH